jgi:hypothetical protein
MIPRIVGMEIYQVQNSLTNSFISMFLGVGLAYPPLKEGVRLHQMPLYVFFSRPR